MKLAGIILTMLFVLLPYLVKALESGSKRKAQQPQTGKSGTQRRQAATTNKRGAAQPRPAVQNQNMRNPYSAAQAATMAQRPTIQQEYFSYETESESEAEARRSSLQPMQVVEEESDSMVFDLRQAVINQAILEPRFSM